MTEEILLAAFQDLPGLAIAIAVVGTATALVAFGGALVRMIDAIETLLTNRKKRQGRP